MKLLIQHSKLHATYAYSERLVDVFKTGSAWSAYEIYPDGLPGLELSFGDTEEAVLDLAKVEILKSQSL